MTEIRIMIVDDNPQFTDSIKRILGFETDFKVAGTASSGKQALEMLVHSPMDIALVDNNLPDMNGFQLTETIAERFPEVQVIILSVDYEKQMIVNAMRSGAKDYIQKPPTSEILVKSIRSAFKKKSRSTAPLPPLPEPKAMGKIIAVYSGKGGVGCTLIATNLAVHLNSREVPCVLVDADMQFGDASLFLNLNTTYSIFDLINVAGELDQNVVDDVLLMHPDGLEVLAAPPQPEMADSITVDVMHKVLAYLRSAFAYVVVDMATELTDVAARIFDLADLILMVVTPDVPSIKNTNYVMDLMSRLDISQDRMEFILNMVEPKDDISPTKVRDSIRMPIAIQIPYDKTAVKRSINRGDPLVLGSKTNPLSLQLIELTNIVKRRLLERALSV